jgi:release factor glutamine methyltransferase
MKLKNILWETTKRLESAGVPSPDSDASWLLEVVMEASYSDLFLMSEQELTPVHLEQLEAFVLRREAREPLQWIIGFTEFYGLKIETRVGVLIPRPETERLVELVLERLPNAPVKVVDIGTGTGAIALALKAERPNIEIVATDINMTALELTRKNAANLNLEIETVQTSILDGLEMMFDAIVSNPPYLPSGDNGTLDIEVQLEPQEALFSGIDGLSLARKIVNAARQKLKSGGLLALELDPRNAHVLANELEPSIWQDVMLKTDLVGRERFVLARRKLSHD